MFEDFVDELYIVKASGVIRVISKQQTPEERQALIDADRERTRQLELDKPFELGGSL